jgi:coenzyme F420-reducing hydrogenase alpha subunit
MKIPINVQRVTRVEGHGNIVVNISDGKVEQLRWEITESPRFFEAMLRGRKYDEVAHITSRICGICCVGHTITSLRATEAALGIEPSRQTVLLRKLLSNGGVLQSHALHYYFLAAPDFLGVGSVFPLVNTHKEVVLRALKLKKLANDLCDLVGGRTVHPISAVVGGFTQLPSPSELREMQDRLKDALTDLQDTVELFSTFNIPDFNRETEYIALKHPDEYAFYDGTISSTDTGTTPAANYLEVTNEFCVPHSTAKHTKHARSSYMVGALARFNNNHDQLLPRAKKAAQDLGLEAPCHNPYMINVAQVVETVHLAEDSINLIDQLLTVGLKEEKPEVGLRAGTGVGACEVPRGILFHDYTYDASGAIVEANCVIPTNQNHANIQQDMEALVPTILDKSADEIRLALEMLVRAYDPCISCSAHLLEVKINP